MPCDSVTTQEHDVGQWKIKDVVEALTTELGATVESQSEDVVTFRTRGYQYGSYDRRSGKITTRDDSITTQQFKQAFAVAGVKSEGRKLGWTVQDVMGQSAAKRALDFARVKAKG